MENSKFETLNLPPYRRRPLRSQTFRSLLRILSIFDEDPQHSQPPVTQASNSDSDGTESGAASKSGECLAHANMVYDELLLHKDSLVDGNRGVSGMEEGDLDNTPLEIVGSDHSLREGIKELAHKDNANLMNSLGNPNRDSSLLTCNLEDQSSVPRHHIKEFTEQIEVDKLPTHINPSLGADKIVTLNPSMNNDEKNLPIGMKALEEVKDDRHINTWVTSENPIVTSGAMRSFLNLTADEEVEDGEISGEFIGFSLEDNMLSKENKVDEEHFPEEVSGKEQIVLDKPVISNMDITSNVGQGMEAEIKAPRRNLVEYNSEIFIRGTAVKSANLNGHRCKAKIGETKKQESGVTKSNSAAVCLRNLVQVGGVSRENRTKNQDIASTKKDAEVRSEKKRQAPPAKEKRANKKICSLQDISEFVVPGKPIEPLKAEGYDCRLESVRNKKQGSGVKNFADPVVCPENLSSLEEPSAENLSQNKENASTEKGDDVSEKKRKRVPTKERKAKKRLKAKMKLAEKEGKPVVKRPQLQPVLKQKPVAHCRHYLLGRCKEGALCNFSHDTTPLTKSKPCSHFARRSCMKGDQCPFDHELSKYPCNNFVTKGSCSRGVDCLFSHEMQASKGSSSSVLKATGPDLLALSLLNNSSSLKRLNVNGPSHEKVDAKSSTIAISPWRSAQQNLAVTTSKPTALAPKGAVTTPKPTAQAPKGTVRAPNHAIQAPKGMSFLSHGKVLQEAGSTLKADDGVKVGHQMTPSASVVVQNNNENIKKTPAVAPLGINFLSFGKKPLVDVSNSSLPVKRNDGIGKSPLSGSCKGEEPDSSLKKDDGVKVDNHISQSPPDDSSSKSQVGSNKDTTVKVLVQERESAHGKFQFPNAVVQSPSPFTGTPSSSQKTILPNTPMSLQNVLKSTLAFASKFESEVKTGQSIGSPAARTDSNKEAGCSSIGSTKASTILDFLYGHSSKTK